MQTSKSKTRLVVAGLLILMALLAGASARRESVTIDEVAHIGAGVSYLQKLDLRMNPEHPPLAKVLAALPLVLRGVHADYSHLSWTFSGEQNFNQFIGEWVFGHWLIMNWNDPYAVVWWARVPMIGVMLLLGLVLYILGSRLGGSWGGLLCLCAYVSMPSFLAFGPLVITDVLIALFWILAVWQLPEMWRSPSRLGVIKFAVILSAAFLTKFSSGLLFFVFVAVALSLRWRVVAEQPTDKVARRRWRRRAWLNLIKATLWAAMFVYVFYFVLSLNQSTDTFNIIPHFPASVLLRRLLMPVWIYFTGLLFFALSAGSRATYILGHTYSHGVWFYFPTLFLLKSPLSFLLLLALCMAIALTLKSRSGAKASVIPAGLDFHWRSIWVSLIVFVGACMINRLNLSIRHFLIALELLILLLAPLPRMVQSLQLSNWRGAAAAKWGTIALAATSLATAVWAFPNYIPFLNVLSAGRPGYLLVNDSNLDWNQSLPEVRKFAAERGLNEILLDEYGFVEPAAYVPQARVWSCQEPAAWDGGKTVFVSASNIADGHNCLWLMQYPRQALAGGSMYAIELPAAIPSAGTPGGPPMPEQFRYLGGFPGIDPRQVFLTSVRDPRQMQPTMDSMREKAQAAAQKKP
jgi:hypothetical protein